MVNMLNNKIKEKVEHLKINPKAKDLLFSLKRRGETYTDLIIRIGEFYKKETADLCPKCGSNQVYETEVTSTKDGKVKRHQVKECTECESIWPPLMKRTY